VVVVGRSSLSSRQETYVTGTFSQLFSLTICRDIQMPTIGRTALLPHGQFLWLICAAAAFICGCNSSGPATNSELGAVRPETRETAVVTSTVEGDSPRYDHQHIQEASRQASSPEDELRAALIADPKNAQAQFRLAGILAQREQLKDSLELLEAIAPDHPQLGLPSLGFAGDLYFATAQFELAKNKYRAVLNIEPNAVPALRHLALILNREGRRHQAVPLLQTLCKLGDVRQDELQALLSVADAIHAERPSGQQVSEFTGYYPIGPFANARWAFSRQRFEEARTQLAHVPSNPSVPADCKAFYARILACNQRTNELGAWLAAGKDAMHDQAEFWTATAMYLIEQKKFDQAVRANAEALLRDPTDLRVYFRMQQALDAIDEKELAHKFWARYLNVRKSIDLGLEAPSR
jgi:tetratricopeptide (TPR) repeat protein